MSAMAAPPYDSGLIAALADVVANTPHSGDPDYLARLRLLCAPVTRASELRAGHPGVQVEEFSVPGPPGAPALVLAMLRAESPTSRGAIYYIHGGGMIAGNRFTNIDYAFRRAREIGLPLVSVEYRLAPEHPHPAPAEDCYAGLVWLSAHAAELGIDPDRIVVMGGSAGGGLAAAVSLMARDRSGPSIAAQMLLGPMLDDRNSSVSSRQFESSGVWHRQNNANGWRALLGDRAGTSEVPVYAAPARAEDLSGLPPTFVDAGSAEVFRDEAVEFARRLWAAGTQAELHVWAGGFHSFDVSAPGAVLSKAAMDAQLSFLRRNVC